MLSSFQALVRKDLRIFFGDRRALLMSVAAPIVLAAFMGYAMGGSGNTERGRVSVRAVDLDESAMSREIVARVTADKSLEVKPAGAGEAREAVHNGKAVVAFVIPKNFGADAGRALFSTAAKPKIGLLYDPSHSAELAMVQGILTGEVMQAVSKEMFSGPSGREMVDQALPQIEKDSSLPAADKKALSDILRSVQRWNIQSNAPGAATGRPASGLSIPFDMGEEAVTSGEGVRYNGYAHAFAGMGVQFILFVGIDVGIGMLQLRQRGLWKRLRAAPLSRGVLLGSRAASAALTSMLVLLILFGFARAVFAVRVEGSMAGFLGVCAAFSLMTAAFGLLIAALGKTPEVTRGLAIFVTLIMVMLGGSWVPSFIFPRWMQTVTLVMPTRWAVDGMEAMLWRGLGFSTAIAPIAVLFGFALVFAVLAVMRFRWEEA